MNRVLVAVIAGMLARMVATAHADDLQDLLTRGRQAFDRGDYHGALEAWTAAVRVSPDHPNAHYGVCAARYRLDELQEAVEACTRAIRLNPDYGQAYYIRGLMRSERLGDNRAALGDFDQAIRVDPRSSAAYLKRGNTRARLGDLQGGLEDYNQAIRLESDYADAYFNRGVVWYRLKDTKRALEDLRLAAEYYRAQGDQVGFQRAVDGVRQVQTEMK